VTKRGGKPGGKDTDDNGIQLLYDHIRKQFVRNARIIAENEKPERLLRMIQTCPELEPVTRANKELWKIVEKVRRQVLGDKSKPGSKNSSKRIRKAKD